MAPLVWTMAPLVAGELLAGRKLKAVPFETSLHDAALGTVRLTGLYADQPASDAIMLIVHGLTGSAESSYCATAACAAEKAGYSTLRLSLRGADETGEDIFHGGQLDDLRAALRSQALERYRRVFILGYSVGGHIALRAGIERIDPRLRAVAAISPPLDLDAATRAFDAPSRRLYRRSIFAGLNRCYARAAARRRAPTPLAQVHQARSCRERDALTVVPRYGFRSEVDYYERASVSNHLHRLAVPSLVIASTRDPITPAGTLRPAVATASRALTVRWLDCGGHVFFPPRVDLGQGGPLGIEPQVVRWLGKQSQN